MKYANLYWQNTELNESKFRTVNIGDNLQFLAIDYIYRKFLSDDKELIRLQLSELIEYKGEQLVLPMNWSLFDINYMVENKIAISDSIVPVFLAATIESGTYREEYFNHYNISYLKRFEPIGCRDAYTFKRLHQYGIKAYLNGCMTAALPKRSGIKKAQKVFLVDVPQEVEKYIPERLLKNSEIMTQQYYYSKDISIDDIIRDIKIQYLKYENEAELVITSRLHVASPCVAMGIPVILTLNQIDARFSWLDQYIPFYDKNSYDKIDWTPEAVEYEDAKTQMIDYAVQRIRMVYDLYTGSERIHALYSGRTDRDYINFRKVFLNNTEKAIAFLQSTYKKTDEFLYSIWGCNETAEKFYNNMCSNYPKSKLKNIIDSYKDLEFHGIQTIKPVEFKIESNEVVFVFPVKASNAAREIFKEKGIQEDRYICCGSEFIS